MKNSIDGTIARLGNIVVFVLAIMLAGVIVSGANGSPAVPPTAELRAPPVRIMLTPPRGAHPRWRRTSTATAVFRGSLR